MSSLLVVAAVNERDPAPAPTCVIAGLPLVKRIVLAARAAGYERILVHDGDGVSSVLAGTGAQVMSATPPPVSAVPTRVVVLPANVLPQPAWLRSLLERSVDADTVYVDASTTAVIETANADAVVAAATSSTADAVIGELRRKFPEASLPAAPDGRYRVAVPSDVAGAETWLLRSLIKQREGFMSRHFERRISLAVTRRLVSTPITPNAMTLVSATIGLVSAPFFLSSRAGWQLTGALLFLAHSILDGCDGELARLKFLQSRVGAVLDFWGDNVVHVAVFGCIAIGWSRDIGAAWPLVPGAIACMATLASAAVMFERIAEDSRRTGSRGARVIDALASRDFIYLLILVSAFGKAGWFLVAVAAGAPAFLVVALWLDRRGRVR